ncbi:hypothetical protein [Mesorhizobium delmotii]|uniref:Uncharacterized protein n=1 Tax=Mesorhizobium delmotii TaxID=1631247 RepID=A0A2P9AMY4_9HYPH|nr:hypothetical protein [Mesorhizobium delmotii]SJM32512.1 hypothetical protein BQ8482_290107 [Mesorhizobium delmotii]
MADLKKPAAALASAAPWSSRPCRERLGAASFCKNVFDAAAIAGIPEPTKQDAARDFLVLPQERLAHYRKARLKFVAGTLRAKRATMVFDTYAR